MNSINRKQGQTGEYGTPEVENNFAVRTVLEKAVMLNAHGVEFPSELYHRTAGYWVAGSCARWNDKEIWGVTHRSRDGSTFGRMFTTLKDAENHWSSLTLKERQILTD